VDNKKKNKNIRQRRLHREQLLILNKIQALQELIEEKENRIKKNA